MWTGSMLVPRLEESSALRKNFQERREEARMAWEGELL